MSRYYCPFCSARYRIHKINSEGVFICGQCGDPLMKKPLVNSRKIFGMVAASAFLLPLLIMIVFVINDITRDRPQNNFKSSDLVTIN
tara:strand:- start:88 stop:348 length:261 start_codon:yes stop_codon:yes gene_type:complete